MICRACCRVAPPRRTPYGSKRASLRFVSARRVVVAEIRGPATITMIHFAMPGTLKLNRDVLLKIYWDGEKDPSVDCPLVDFFCDAAGRRDDVNTALVNKRRGWNAYFPMPFRQSARVELVYDGPLPPGEKLCEQMPCYSYVMYRTLADVPAASGYFHAHWRQETLLLGKRDYVALEARGKGKFIGWNVTVRQPGVDGYPVDQNEKFFIDGEKEASVELQGMEDSFGFSWGFPESQSVFPLTGFYRFFRGAWRVSLLCAGRDQLPEVAPRGDRFRQARGSDVSADLQPARQPPAILQYGVLVSSRAARRAAGHAARRGACAAPEDRFWPEKEKLPSLQSLKSRGVKLAMFCGRPERELILAAPGYAVVVKNSQAWSGWAPPVYYCRSSVTNLDIELTVPPAAQGTLRLYMIDPDEFGGGRRQTVTVAGKSLGQIERFEHGRWLEQRLARGRRPPAGYRSASATTGPARMR